VIAFSREGQFLRFVVLLSAKAGIDHLLELPQPGYEFNPWGLCARRGSRRAWTLCRRQDLPLDCQKGTEPQEDAATSRKSGTLRLTASSLQPSRLTYEI